MKYHAVFLILLGCISSFVSAQDAKWSLKSDKDGIKVYYRKVESKYELRLTTSIQTSLSAFTHLLNEIELAPTWAYKIISSTELKRISPSEIYYHTMIDFPWPLTDRDLVMHNVMTQDPDTKVITSLSKAASDMLEKQSDKIRITNATTKWTIYPPDAQGWAYCEYYLFTDPAGNIPDWVVNLAIEVGPRETVKAIKRELAKPDYQAVRLAHIKD